MALKFSQNYMDVIKAGVDVYTWQIKITGPAAFEDSVSVTPTLSNDDIVFVALGSSKSFTIPIGKTVNKIELQSKLGAGAFVTHAEDTVANGYYEYGGVFEVTNMKVSYSYTNI